MSYTWLTELEYFAIQVLALAKQDIKYIPTQAQ